MNISKAAKTWSAKQWKEWRSTILFFVFIVIPIKSSFADLNWVPTGSMNPTIVEGDLVYVNKMAYDIHIPLTSKSIAHISDPQRGDIAVLFSPEDGTRLVKRVIGIPGDTLEMSNRSLIINGEPLKYKSLSSEESQDLSKKLQASSIFAQEQLNHHGHAVMSIPSISGAKRSFSPITLPEGHYFVMGDNRDNSLDSRSFGLVERNLFAGKAESVLASFNILDWYQPRPSRFLKNLK